MRSYYKTRISILSVAFCVFCVCCTTSIFASDLLVEVAKNSVSITGTARSEFFDICEGKNGNVIIFAFGGTTANGQETFDTGVDLSDLNNLIIDLKGGDDEVSVNFDVDNPGPEGVQGNVEIRMGAGEDFVRLQAGDVGGDVNVIMNGGDDTFVFRSTTVFGNVRYLGGAGADSAFFGRKFNSEPVVIMGDLMTRCAGGDDTTFYITGTVVGNLSHSDGGGADQMFYENFLVMGGMDYAGGGSSDTGRFGGGVFCQIEGGLDIRGGGGSDVLDFGIGGNVVCTDAFTYAGGSGRDTINAGDFANFQGTISASMGRGNDAINYSEFVSFVVPGTLNGGADIDSIQPSALELEAIGFAVIGFEN